MISYKSFDGVAGGDDMRKEKKEMCQVTIRMPEKERLLAEKLAEYLHEHELIKRPSINEAVRYSLMYLAYVIAKQAEQGGVPDEE